MTRSLPCSLLRAGLAALSLCVTSLPALAHAGADAGGHHGFWAGVSHPLLGWDHLAAMLAVGFQAGTAAGHDPARRWVGPLAFCALLLAGALAARGGWLPGGLEVTLAVSLLVFGLLAASGRRWPPAGVAALVGGFALFHGAAHGHELAGAAALAGMLLATALLHAAGIALGTAARARGALWRRLPGALVAGLGAWAVAPLWMAA
ncbi:HupE/UreJ family protein [Caldimonas brevitalea]|nr:HupE/UreJ family protein [Caldimonas brevitalea]